MSIVREAAVAGTFYSDNPKVLAMEVERYLTKAKVGALGGEVMGLVSPHAGYVYSGQVAAYGMKAASAGSYDTVILIGPSHRAYFEKAAVMTEGAYRTPLGLVEIDEEVATAVAEKGNLFSARTDAHRQEHSLEVQLPFLQTALPPFRLVPIVMGAQEAGRCEPLASAIFDAVKDRGRRLLVVGSTDLSHYYPYSHAVELDRIVVDRLARFDIEGLSEELERESCEACGKGPMLVTMMLSRALGATTGKVLAYANSGDVSGDRRSVVGYVSAVFVKGGPAAS